MISDKIKSADFKMEKHVPVIICADSVKQGEDFKIEVSVGKEIPHPNTPSHFIEWISVLFTPKGGAIPVELARCTFSAHGATAIADGKGPAFTAPTLVLNVQLQGPGTIEALSYCNIHGLWQSSKEIN